MSFAQNIEALRRDKDDADRPLSSHERENLIRPLLPVPREGAEPPRSFKPSNTIPPELQRRLRLDQDRLQRRLGARNLLSLLLHKLLFFLVHLAFSIYITLRQSYHALLGRIFTVLYYHHRTPELIQRDVKNLGKIPQHLSVIVDLNSDEVRAGAAPESLSRLIGDVAELAAWCTCAGIPLLSVYERTGSLKTHISSLYAETRNTFSSYFPPESQPSVHIRAAPDNRSAYSPPEPSFGLDSDSNGEPQPKPAHLDMLLLSASDGRATLVDLTKTLAEMSQRQKLGPADISAELIHAEIEESSCSEPDLLVVMAGIGGALKRRQKNKKKGRRKNTLLTAVDRESDSLQEFPGGGGGICLQGYPPWQVRLTEIFYMQDNTGVDYQVFLRALYRYAKAEMRFGR